MTQASPAGDQILSIVERVESLHSEKKDTETLIADLYREARGTGLDVKIIKDIVKLRRQDPSERNEHDTMLDVYLKAIEDAARKQRAA